MNKLWKIFGALALLLFIVQAGLAWKFCSLTPRIEVFTSNVDGAAAQAEKAGCAYEVANGSRVDVFSSRLFLAQELRARLDPQECSAVNDRSQASLLARQAVESVVFAAELWIFILCLVVLFRIVGKAKGFWREKLEDQYPGEILEEYAVEALVLAIQVTALVLVMALLLLRILGFTLYLPQSIMPYDYILRVSQWFSRPAPALPELSSYEMLCRRMLPTLYAIGGACILSGSLALGFGIRGSGKRKGRKTKSSKTKGQ